MSKFTVSELLEAHDELENRVERIANAYKKIDGADARHEWFLNDWEHHEDGLYLRFECCYSCDSDYSSLEVPAEWLELDEPAVFERVKEHLEQLAAEAKRIRAQEERIKAEKHEAAERREYERLREKYED